MQNFPAVSTYRKTLLAMMVLAFVAVFFLPQNANAQSGKRICLSQHGTYAAKIDDWSTAQSACRTNVDESNLSQSANWGDGTVLTCDQYASQYLKWEDWDPCAEMNEAQHYHYVSPNGNYGPGQIINKIILRDNTIHPVAKIPRDKSIKAGNQCGATSCGLLISFGRTRDFSYTYGFSAGGDIFGATVSFTVGHGQNVSQTLNYNWEEGLIPGLQINFDNTTTPEWDFRNIDDIMQQVKSYSKNFPTSERALELTNKFRFCNSGHTQQALPWMNYTGNNALRTFDIGGYFIEINSGNAKSNYGTAAQTYNDDYNEYGGATTAYYYNYVLCGQTLEIATNENTWRSGHAGDDIEWSAKIHFNHGTVQ
jgi:hypothetical protein